MSAVLAFLAERRSVSEVDSSAIMAVVFLSGVSRPESVGWVVRVWLYSGASARSCTGFLILIV